MSDAKLQKVVLPPDFIDLSFGEPVVVTKAFYKAINRFGDPFKMPTIQDLLKWTYQPAAGKPDLVSLLEQKHGAKVVVGNGAKHVLNCALYSMKRAGAQSAWLDIPYYPASPQFIESVGLVRSTDQSADVRLVTSPNNPDGKNYSNDELLQISSKGPTIHDAAYYTPIYLPSNQDPINIGDIQIYSASKMYGISGVRIGYAVCHNDRYYQDMTNFIEMTTAGVSAPSQDIMRNVELFFNDNPNLLDSFQREARASITEARNLLSTIDSDVLEIDSTEANSMFAWAKVGPALNAEAAKVYILPGELFGKPGYVRMNIAQPKEILIEAIRRLNNNKN